MTLGTRQFSSTALPARGSIGPVPRALDLLRLVPPFQGAGDGALAELAARAVWRTHRRGEPLFRQGEAATALHVVAAGDVRLYRVARGGTRELTLAVEGPRRLPELAAVLGEPPTHTLHAEALGPSTEVLCLPADAVHHAIARTPALAAAVIAHLARREAEARAHLDALVFSGVGERLAAYLLSRGPHALPPNSELAALLGTVPEIVSRKLGEFYRLGWIGMERRMVTLTQVDELRRLAGSE